VEDSVILAEEEAVMKVFAGIDVGKRELVAGAVAASPGVE